MGIKIYNTLTRQKEEFRPIEPGKVGIYLCGPTVYKKSHIGHAVGPVIFDTIRRWLECVHDYKVTFVLNVTDVDDKLIVAANEQGRPMSEIAADVLADYLRAMDALNVRPPTHMPKATENIDDIIAMVERLIDRGYGYQVDGDVYFDVTKFEEYGKLSRRSIDDQQAGSRELQSGECKRNAWDFALWKGAKPGEPAWDSPWGPGRPGWHIECSAMSIKRLGETFDIHGGGLDLVFPHHENEIAQSEAATGKRFVNYWMHNGLTRVETRKMSKSIGNVRSLEELLGQWPGEVLRFFILSTHYRRPIDFSDEQISKVAKGLQTFYRLFERVSEITGHDVYGGFEGEAFVRATASRLYADLVPVEEQFKQAMDDDFNTAQAISALFEMANRINWCIEQAKISKKSPDEDKNSVLAAAVRLLKNARLLGLFETPPEKAVSDELAESLVELLIDVRTRARAEKPFGIAGTIRDRLAVLGIQLKDGRDGTTWEKTG